MEFDKQIAGMISRKHVYEIAKIKSEDEMWQQYDLKDICDKVIDEAFTIGIKVVDTLEAEEYGEFLKQREQMILDEKAALQAAREAKLLRTL